MAVTYSELGAVIATCKCGRRGRARAFRPVSKNTVIKRGFGGHIWPEEKTARGAWVCLEACVCGFVPARVEPIIGRRTEHVCGSKCTGATGHVCDCSCGGKNHGMGATLAAVQS